MFTAAGVCLCFSYYTSGTEVRVHLYIAPLPRAADKLIVTLGMVNCQTFRLTPHVVVLDSSTFTGAYMNTDKRFVSQRELAGWLRPPAHVTTLKPIMD
jgi:hypothetical protein